MAWAFENSKVKLQAMPSFSSYSAALIPCHVEASLIKTRFLSIPAFS